MTIIEQKSAANHSRRFIFEKSKRIIVKVGSAVLTSGNSMNFNVIDNLAKEISILHSSGKEVILVSSGAVAAGKKKLSFNGAKDISLQEKQALAAIGQSHLMHIYDVAFSKHNKNIAQALLTHADLAHRDRYINFKNTILTLLKMGVIPIINENDTVATEELQFGDNDNLGALVTNLMEGDVFICLTDIDCLYTANPLTHPDAIPVHTVEEVTEEIEKMAGNSTSALGTGGMKSKIAAAKKVANGGGASFIGPGRMPDVLQALFSGQLIGTCFLPQRKKLHGKKQWIAFVLKPKGRLSLDTGAVRAISCDGKSLLPSGVLAVNGIFNAGDSVQCLDEQGQVIAVGTTNYRSEDIDRIKGKNSCAIGKILGYKDSDVVVHRDNLVVF
ncbi:MAG: glutamate 5-kinase [Desulfopila sp.]|jgi:glutamate 5-kinase|nr:glutamate 5-kinase [Desulfopila sp.]